MNLRAGHRPIRARQFPTIIGYKKKQPILVKLVVNLVNRAGLITTPWTRNHSLVLTRQNLISQRLVRVRGEQSSNRGVIN